MAEIGVDISAQRSKSVDEFRDVAFDLVVTLCDGAAENCPLWLGRGQRLHMCFPDPATAPGNEAERLKAFRQVRDALRSRVLGCLETQKE
jgi:arsenate reductase